MVLFRYLRCFVRSFFLQVRAIQSLARCAYLIRFLMSQLRSPFLHRSILPSPFPLAKKVCYLPLEFLVGRSLQLAVACLHSQVSQGHAVRATQ